jgi:hypothetical protein
MADKAWGWLTPYFNREVKNAWDFISTSHKPSQSYHRYFYLIINIIVRTLSIFTWDDETKRRFSWDSGLSAATAIQ